MKKLRLLFALLTLTLGWSNVSAQTWTTGQEVGEGTFYLYNVGAGKFLNAGDPASGWGTHSYLTSNFGFDVVLAGSDGKYTIDTSISNGGDSHFLAANCWTDGGAVSWEFTVVTVEGLTNAYTISTSGNFLVADTDDSYGGTTVLTATEVTDNKGYWLLVSKEDMINNIKTTASKTNPVDATFLVKSANFDRNDIRGAWTQTHSGANFTFMGKHQESWGSQNFVDAGNSKFYGIEAYGNSYEIKQTINALPAGTYELTCQGFDNGDNTSYIYAGSTEKAFAVTSPGTADLSEALENIANGQYTGNTTGTFNISEDNASIEIGFKRPNSGSWAVIDNARLIYYGLDLSQFEEELAAAVAAAEAVEGTIPTAAYEILANVVSEKNKSYTSAADYSAATTAIVEATTTAKALVADYSRYNKVKNAIKAINSSIDLTAADTEVEAATTTDAIDAAVVTARNALTSNLPTVQPGSGETIDLTDALIDNASPGTAGTLDYWINSGSPGLEHQLYEYWNVSGGSTKQTISATLPTGNYKLTAIAYTRDNMTAKLNAGINSTNLVGCGSVNNRTQGDAWIANGNGVNNLVFNLAEATTDLEIGLTADSSTGDHWMCWRSFTLVYGDVFEPYTLVDGKMNHEVSTAQTTAETAYKDNPSPTTYQALLEAIAAAQASKNAYTNAKTELDKMVEELTGTNVYTADAYAAQITDNIEAYENGTLSDAEANAITMLAGWHAPNTIDDVLISAWEPDAENWDSYHVNTWSDEGDSDGSNFKVPFIEYWVNDGENLASKTLIATLENVEAGNYEVKATVRVRIKNGASGPTGITMQVGDGTEVDVTNGSQIGDSQFYLKEATAYGQVGEDGKLVIKFDVTSDNNISWLAFKNMNYKVSTIDYGSLIAAIDAANSVNSGMEVASLTTAIATANEALEAVSQEEVDAATEALVAATETAITVIAARKNLAGVAKKATALKTFLDEDITEAISSATEYAANAEATAEEANSKADALNANFAEWEVVTLNNATFDTGLNGELINPGTEAKPYVHAVDGWTQNFTFNATASQGIAAAYGSAAQNGTNGTAAPATDMFGKSEGGTLHLSSGWNDQARYYQEVENLPAGKYVFYYEGFNANNTPNALHSNYFGIGNLTKGDIEGTQNTFKFSDEKKFAYNEWKPVAFDFVLNNSVQNAYVNVGLIGVTGGSDSTTKMWFDNVTIYCLYKTEKVTIKEGFTGTTYSSAYPIDFSAAEGLTAYIITDVVKGKCVTTPVTKVPAGTGVYVEGAAAEYKVKVIGENSEFSTVAGNLLIGTGAESATVTSDATTTYYMYGKQNGKENFYKVGTGKERTASAHKAYLAIPTSNENSAKEILFIGEDTATGINTVEKNDVNGEVYNLNGQRVNNAQKGVYIVNGKKVVLK